MSAGHFCLCLTLKQHWIPRSISIILLNSPSLFPSRPKQSHEYNSHSFSLSLPSPSKNQNQKSLHLQSKTINYKNNNELNNLPIIWWFYNLINLATPIMLQLSKAVSSTCICLQIKSLSSLPISETKLDTKLALISMKQPRSKIIFFRSTTLPCTWTMIIY